MIACTLCGAENSERANFCRKCGAKLREECDCWVKKEPYNCGQGKCPGYRLFLVEKVINTNFLTIGKAGGKAKSKID